MKRKEDKLGAEKLVTVPADLSKLCVVLKNYVKKDIYIKPPLKILKIKYLYN